MLQNVTKMLHCLLPPDGLSLSEIDITRNAGLLVISIYVQLLYQTKERYPHFRYRFSLHCRRVKCLSGIEFCGKIIGDVSTDTALNYLMFLIMPCY